MLLLPHGVHLKEEVELDNDVGITVEDDIVLDEEVIELGVAVEIFFKFIKFIKFKFATSSSCPP